MKILWVIFHTIMVLITGGVWFIPLVIWWVLTRTRRST